MKRQHKHSASRSAIRNADVRDIPALVALENRTFMGDWVSPRSFRHLLTRGNAVTFLEEEGGMLRGYALAFFRKATTLARLYSFAVAAEHRGKGIAKALLGAVERAARARGCSTMRLEVRRDNAEARALYVRAGYREIGIVPGYYDDRMDAVRMEKVFQRKKEAQAHGRVTPTEGAPRRSPVGRSRPR